MKYTFEEYLEERRRRRDEREQRLDRSGQFIGEGRAYTGMPGETGTTISFEEYLTQRGINPAATPQPDIGLEAPGPVPTFSDPRAPITPPPGAIAPPPGGFPPATAPADVSEPLPETIPPLSQQQRFQYHEPNLDLSQGPDGNVPQRHLSPGNVKSSPATDVFAAKGPDGQPLKDDEGHLIFDDAAAGWQALWADIEAKQQGRSRYVAPGATLAEMGQVYAEDPAWAQKVASMLGLPDTTPIADIPTGDLAKAIARQEGWYAGGPIPEGSIGPTPVVGPPDDVAAAAGLAQQPTATVTDVTRIGPETTIDPTTSAQIAAQTPTQPQTGVEFLDEPTAFARGINATLDTAAPSTGSAIEAIGHVIGSDEVVQLGGRVRDFLTPLQPTQREAGSLSRAIWDGEDIDLWTWMGETTGSAAVYMLPIAAFARAGQAAAFALGAGRAGQTAASIGASYPVSWTLMTGEAWEELTTDPKTGQRRHMTPEEAANQARWAIGLGAFNSSLELAGMGMMRIGPLRQALQRLTKNKGASIVVGAQGEGLTEILQEATVLAKARGGIQNLTEDDWYNLGEAYLAGAFVGGGMGAYGAARAPASSDAALSPVDQAIAQQQALQAVQAPGRGQGAPPQPLSYEQVQLEAGPDVTQGGETILKANEILLEQYKRQEERIKRLEAAAPAIETPIEEPAPEIELPTPDIEESATRVDELLTTAGVPDKQRKVLIDAIRRDPSKAPQALERAEILAGESEMAATDRDAREAFVAAEGEIEFEVPGVIEGEPGMVALERTEEGWRSRARRQDGTEETEDYKDYGQALQRIQRQYQTPLESDMIERRAAEEEVADSSYQAELERKEEQEKKGELKSLAQMFRGTLTHGGHEEIERKVGKPDTPHMRMALGKLKVAKNRPHEGIGFEQALIQAWDGPNRPVLEAAGVKGPEDTDGLAIALANKDLFYQKVPASAPDVATDIDAAAEEEMQIRLEAEAAERGVSVEELEAQALAEFEAEEAEAEAEAERMAAQDFDPDTDPELRDEIQAEIEAIYGDEDVPFEGAKGFDRPELQYTQDDLGAQAIAQYGLTEIPEAAGYMLPDGEMIDFAYGTGQRVEDHRSINGLGIDPETDEGESMLYDTVNDAGSSRGYMLDFMDRAGAVRMHVDDSHVMIDHMSDLTPRQRQRLARIAAGKSTVAIDRGHMEIDPYYDDGRLRYVSDGSVLLENPTTYEIMAALDPEGGVAMAESRAFELEHENVLVPRTIQVAHSVIKNPMPGKEALKILKKKGSVKPDEVFWTGLDIWLEDQKRVTAEDIVDYMKDKAPRVLTWKAGDPLVNSKLKIVGPIENVIAEIRDVQNDPQEKTRVGRVQFYMADELYPGVAYHVVANVYPAHPGYDKPSLLRTEITTTPIWAGDVSWPDALLGPRTGGEGGSWDDLRDEGLLGNYGADWPDKLKSTTRDVNLNWYGFLQADRGTVIDEALLQEVWEGLDFDYSQSPGYSAHNTLASEKLVELAREARAMHVELQKSFVPDFLPETRYANYAPRLSKHAGQNYAEYVMAFDAFKAADAMDEAAYYEITSEAGTKSGMNIDIVHRAEQMRSASRWESPHWEDVPGNVAHARTTTVQGPNGEKVLWLMEVQSDPYQIMRDQGSPDMKETDDEKYEALEAEAATLDDGKRLAQVQGEMARIEKRRNHDSPYVAPRHPWSTGAYDMPTKTMLRLAAEKGYDAIVLPTGHDQWEVNGGLGINWSTVDDRDVQVAIDVVSTGGIAFLEIPIRHPEPMLIMVRSIVDDDGPRPMLTYVVERVNHPQERNTAFKTSDVNNYGEPLSVNAELVAKEIRSGKRTYATITEDVLSEVGTDEGRHTGIYIMPFEKRNFLVDQYRMGLTSLIGQFINALEGPSTSTEYGRPTFDEKLLRNTNDTNFLMDQFDNPTGAVSAYAKQGFYLRSSSDFGTYFGHVNSQEELERFAEQDLTMRHTIPEDRVGEMWELMQGKPDGLYAHRLQAFQKYYEVVLPRMINELAKKGKWNTKVQDIPFIEEALGTSDIVHTRKGIPITDEMKQQIRQGQAMWESPVPMMSPVSNGWGLKPLRDDDALRTRQRLRSAKHKGDAIGTQDGVKVLAKAVTTDIETRGHLDLTNIKLESALERAKAFQIFRNPYYETMRLVITDADTNQELSTIAWTSFAVDHVGHYLDKISKGVSRALADRGKARGAKWFEDAVRRINRKVLTSQLRRMRRRATNGEIKVHLVHNHPTGTAKPSLGDQMMTQAWSELIDGIDGAYLGDHVVIDTGEFSVIQADGTYNLYDLTTGDILVEGSRYDANEREVDLELEPRRQQARRTDPLLGMAGRQYAGRVNPDWLEQPIMYRQELALIGEALQSPNQYVSVLFQDGQNYIRGIMEMPVDKLKAMSDEDLQAWLKDRSLELGGRRATLFYGGEEGSYYDAQEFIDRFRPLAQSGVLEDAIHLPSRYQAGVESNLDRRAYMEVEPPIAAEKPRVLARLPRSYVVDGLQVAAEKKGHQAGIRLEPVIDKLAQRFPDPLESENKWRRFWATVSGAAKSTVMLKPPYKAIAYRSDPAQIAELVGSLTDAQLKDKAEGMALVAGTRADYIAGNVAPQETALNLLWGILSRMASPYEQEAMFTDVVAEPRLYDFITRAIEGEFPLDREVEMVDSAGVKKRIRFNSAWDAFVEEVADRNALSPGSYVRSNLHSFGADAAGRILAEGALKITADQAKALGGHKGKTRLQAWHDMMGDPAMTGRQLRRNWHKMFDKPGIDNKVVSFVALISGFDDVMILDRVQARNLWDGIARRDEFKNQNIYSKEFVDQVSGMRGLAMYEALEDGLRQPVRDAYASLGRPEDGTIGSWHWESWVAASNQEVGHGSLEILARARGAQPTEGAREGVMTRQGKFSTYGYGTEYGYVGGEPVFVYRNSQGLPLLYDRQSLQEFMKELEGQSRRKVLENETERAIPHGFKVSEDFRTDPESGELLPPDADGFPWINHPHVNRDALDAVAARHGRRPTFGEAESLGLTYAEQRAYGLTAAYEAARGFEGDDREPLLAKRPNGQFEDKRLRDLVAGGMPLSKLEALIEEALETARLGGSMYPVNTEFTDVIVRETGSDFGPARELALSITGDIAKRHMPEPVASAYSMGPETAAWFDGSKVVDDQGNPLLLYRGETKSDELIHTRLNTPAFTDVFEIANAYTTEQVGASRVTPVYLKITNPIDLNPEDYDDMVDWPQLKKWLPNATKADLDRLFDDVEHWRDEGGYLEEQRAEIDRDAPGKMIWANSYVVSDSAVFVELAKKEGYDGVTYRGTFTSPQYFDPSLGGRGEGVVERDTSYDTEAAREWRPFDWEEQVRPAISDATREEPTPFWDDIDPDNETDPEKLWDLFMGKDPQPLEPRKAEPPPGETVPAGTPPPGQPLEERRFPITAERYGLPPGESLLYAPITNDATENQARMKIGTLGVEGAVSELNERIDDGRLEAIDTAVGVGAMAVYQARANQAKEEGDEQGAADAITAGMRVASKLAEALTAAGQAIQAVKIIARMSPESVLIYAQRKIDNINAGRPGWERETQPERELTQAEAEKLQDLAATAQDFQGLGVQGLEVGGLVERVLQNQELEEGDIARLRDFLGQVREVLGDEQLGIIEESKKKKKGRRKAVDSIVGGLLSRAAKEARARLRDRGIQLPAGIDPSLVRDYAIIGAETMHVTGKKFKAWAEAMTEATDLEFGDLRQIWSESASILRENRARGRRIYARSRAISDLLTAAEQQETLTAADAAMLSKLVSNVREAVGEVQIELAQELAATLAAFEDPTLSEKLRSAQTMAQLLNPKTLLRNLIGNELFWIMERTSRMAATPVDIVVSKATGRPRTITWRHGGRGGYGDYFRALGRGSRAAWRGIDPYNLGGKFDMPAAPAFRGPGWIQQVVEKFTGEEMKADINVPAFFEKVLGVALRGFDFAAFERARLRYLAEQGWLEAERQGVEDKKAFVDTYIANADQLEAEVQENAEQAGLYVTFQDETRLSEGAVKLKRGLNKFFGLGPDGKRWGLGDFLIKYPKTPANLFSRALDYSPVGYLYSLATLLEPRFKAGSRTEVDQEKLLMNLSRATVGAVGFTALGIYLVGKGVLRGAGDEDDETRRLLREEAGIAPNTVNISALMRFLKSLDPADLDRRHGDRFYEYNWLQPLAINLMVAANAAEQLNKAKLRNARLEGAPVDLDLFAVAREAFRGGLSAFGEMPTLQALSEIDPSDLYRSGERVLVSAPASFVPTALKMGAEQETPTQREGYRGGLLEQTLNQIAQKVPFLREDVAPQYRTIASRTEDGVFRYTERDGELVPLVEEVPVYSGAEEDTRFGRFLNLFINPGRTHTYAPDPLIEMLVLAHEETGMTTHMPRRAKRKMPIQRGAGAYETTLTADDFAELQRVTAEEISRELSAKDLEQMEEMPAVNQVKIVHDSLTRAGQRARNHWFNNMAHRYTVGVEEEE